MTTLSSAVQFFGQARLVGLCSGVSLLNGSLYAWPHRLVVLGPVTEASPFVDDPTPWADFAKTHSSPDNEGAMYDMFTEMESVGETDWPGRARAKMQEEPLLSNCQVSFQHSHGFCPQILLSVGEEQAT